MKKKAGRSAVICLSVAAFVVALVAFVLALVIWADPKLVPNIKANYYDNEESTTEPEPSKEPEPEPVMKLNFGDSGKIGKEGRVYTFGTTDRTSLLSQVSDDGYVTGFFVDIVRRLCKEAKKTCRFIIVKSYRTIWDGRLHVSEGLLRRYFDGGLLVSHTATRAAGYAFTEPILKELPSVVFRKNGTSFTEEDIGTARIGFVAGAYTSPECLQKDTGKTIPKENVVIYHSLPEVLTGFEKNEIDLAFVIPFRVFQVALEKVVSYDGCSNGHVSVLVRKDSPVQAWMSDVTRMMKKNGQFKEMCDELQSKYAEEPFVCEV